MDATQLWDTTMDPDKRRLNRITVKDAEEAENMLAVCMGKDVEARRISSSQKAARSPLNDDDDEQEQKKKKQSLEKERN